MKTKSLGLIWIAAKDVKKAVQYYTDVIGLKLLQFHEQYGWAELQGHDGGTRFGIAQMNSDEWLPGQNGCPTLEVADLDQAKTEAKKNRAHFLGDIVEVPGHVRMQMVADPDGNRFQLVQKLF